jgi:hypothetical protein
VLDREGRVTVVNEAWLTAATRLDSPGARVATGGDYLTACRSGMLETPALGKLLDGVQAALSGQPSTHEVTLQCRSEGRACATPGPASIVFVRRGGPGLLRSLVQPIAAEDNAAVNDQRIWH